MVAAGVHVMKEAAMTIQHQGHAVAEQALWEGSVNGKHILMEAGALTRAVLITQVSLLAILHLLPKNALGLIITVQKLLVITLDIRMHQLA